MNPGPEPANRADPDGWLLVSDIDDTLTGDDEAFRAFCRSVEACPRLEVVLNSSRPIGSVAETVRNFPAPFEPGGLITAMGTEVRLGDRFESEWQLRFGEWDRGLVDGALAELGFERHSDEFQTPFKASYAVPHTELARARAAVAATGQPARIIASGESDFDVLPPEAGKGPATLFVAERLGIDAAARLIVAGDSRNDLEMFEVSDHGILVGNARDELRSPVNRARSYEAKANHAAGVLEGLRYWGVPIDTPAST